MKVKNIPVGLIDVAGENVRRNETFGRDAPDHVMKVAAGVKRGAPKGLLTVRLVLIRARNQREKSGSA
ncbi:MAG: hypothetical protein ACREAZ_01565 [Nitrososphaera sp.]